MNALMLLLVLLQGQQRVDPDAQLGEAIRLRDLALYDRAEEILRVFLRTAPVDSQLQRYIPSFRAALCEVLLGARKFEELKIEAEPLRKHPKTRLQGLSLLAAGAWHSGQIAEAQELCDEGDKAAADPASDASPEHRRRLRTVRGLLGWKRFETATHIVHHPADSPIAADAAAFGRRLDVTFDRVRAELDVVIGGKLEAFFFNDQAQADEMVERTLTTSFPALRTYYARADAPPGYAIAQVVSFYVANRRERRPPKLAGLCEGFYSAHADDERWERRRNEIPRKLAADGKLPALDEILSRPGGDAKAFAVSGSFVRWLIRTRGRELFRKFWAEYNELLGTENPDPRKPWAEVYGVPLEDLETAWRSSIR